MNTSISLFTSLMLSTVSTHAQTRPGNALRIPPTFTGGDLRAHATKSEIWPGYQTDVLAFNGTAPGPTIRVSRGAIFSTRLVNAMTEPLTVHWHGVLAPGDMDDVLGWSWLYPPYFSHFRARALEDTSAIFFYATRLREACESDPDLGYELTKRTTHLVIHRLLAAKRQLWMPAANQ